MIPHQYIDMLKAELRDATHYEMWAFKARVREQRYDYEKFMDIAAMHRRRAGDMMENMLLRFPCEGSC